MHSLWLYMDISTSMEHHRSVFEMEYQIACIVLQVHELCNRIRTFDGETEVTDRSSRVVLNFVLLKPFVALSIHVAFSSFIFNSFLSLTMLSQTPNSKKYNKQIHNDQKVSKSHSMKKEIHHHTRFNGQGEIESHQN